jgi:hypothetical protein
MPIYAVEFLPNVMSGLWAVLDDNGTSMAMDWMFFPTNLLSSLVGTIIYSLLGILVVFAAVRFWDKVTPGHLEEEVFLKGNVAAAIFGSALVLGLSIIVAVAIHG